MKKWKSLTKIDLTQKFPFSSTFLEVHSLLVITQSRPLSIEQVVSEFSEQPADVITDGDKKMKKKNPTNNYHIPEEIRLGSQENQNFEQIKSGHRGFRF